MAHFVSKAPCDLLWSGCSVNVRRSTLSSGYQQTATKPKRRNRLHHTFFVFAQIPLGEATMIYEFEPHSTFPLEQDLQPSVWTVTGFVVLPLYTGFLNQTTWVSFDVQTFSSKPNWQTLSCLKVQEMERSLCCSSLLKGSCIFWFDFDTIFTKITSARAVIYHSTEFKNNLQLCTLDS